MLGDIESKQIIGEPLEKFGEVLYFFHILVNHCTISRL